jgi:serine/threonine-protein kinase
MSEPLTRLTAALSDRYTIERELGAGGMATVYLAHDVKHDRQVAIKVLRPELAADVGAERFLREIRTTANLRHPNILPLYDSGQVTVQNEAQGPELRAQDMLFYVMPYIQGETLRDRLDRETQLPIDAALALVREIAAALQFAHDHNVIHRDIKPENILLDRGHAMVADFGIARALTAPGDPRLTQTGISLGTPTYASPEQATSDVVDARSDLYSLACVLYEMLAGAPPFSGPTALVMMARHALDPVPPLATARPGISPQLARTIERALAKSPADRYDTVEHWMIALDSTSAAGGDAALAQPTDRDASARHRTVAVAPFRVSGSDRALTELAEGLAEDIAAGLTRFDYLTVIGGGIDATGPLIGSATNPEAGYLVRGQLRSAGTMLRLNVSVVDVRTGAQLWAETYDRPREGVSLFEIQDDLTDRVVATIGDYSGVLVRSIATELRTVADDDLTSADWIIRTISFMQTIYPPEEHLRLRNAMTTLIASEPNNAEAHAWLAMLIRVEHLFEYNRLDDPIGRWEREAQRAVELDPTSQVGWDGIANARFFRGDLAGFEVAMERTMALNPRNTFTTASCALLLGISGQWERASRLTERACALNPQHPEWYNFPTFNLHYRRGEYQAAFDVMKRINAPQLPYTHIDIAAVCGQLGRPAEGAPSIDVVRQTFGDDVEAIRREYRKWRQTPEMIALVAEGLLKCGLGGK